MPAARSALETLLDTIRQALAPVAVGLAGQAGDTDQDDAEVLLTPVALRRVGRSRRAGALLDLELTVAVTAQGPDAIDHLERLLVLAETRGLAVASAPEPPVLGLNLALPVTVSIDEPTGPRVETVVVDVLPTVTRDGPPGVPVGAASGASAYAIETSSTPEGS